MAATKCIVTTSPTNARRVIPVLSETGAGPYRHVYEIPDGSLSGAAAEKVYPLSSNTANAEKVYFSPSGGDSWLWSLVFGNGLYAGLYIDFTSLTPIGGLDPLYTASAAGVPVTASGNTIGISLSQDQGPTLGTEIVTNGDFAADANWTKGTGWTISGGAASRGPQGGGSAISQEVTLVAGAVYQITYTITSIAAGSIQAQFATGSTVSGASRSTAGTFTELMVAASGNNTLQMFATSAAFSGSIDNVSVRRVLGNHAYQSTSGSRGTWNSGGYWLGDGSDDHLVTGLVPGNDMTIIAAIYPTAASDVVAGTAASVDFRSLGIGTNASGELTLMLGSSALSTSTIKGSTDIRNAWSVASAIGAGTVGTLRLNGALVASGAAGGALNTSVAYMVGAYNSGGLAANRFAGRIARILIVQRSNMSAGLIANVERAVGAGFVSF